MRFKGVIGCAIALWLPAACVSAPPVSVSWDPAVYAVVRSRDWEQIALGDFIISNGPWGKGSISDYRQWIFKALSGSNVPFGWKWKWPKERPDDVKSYQSLSYGWNPWADKRTNTALPMRIGDIAELRLDYEAAVNASAKYNLSFDFWITEKSGITKEKELNVKREFMIWVDRKEAVFDPYWYAGIVNIGGEDYEFYRIPDLKGTLSSRDFMIFMNRKPMPGGSIDVEDFLAWLLEKKYLTEDEYLANVDFGNEIWYGEGETAINRFDVSLTAR